MSFPPPASDGLVTIHWCSVHPHGCTGAGMWQTTSMTWGSCLLIKIQPAGLDCRERVSRSCGCNQWMQRRDRNALRLGSILDNHVWLCIWLVNANSVTLTHLLTQVLMLFMFFIIPIFNTSSSGNYKCHRLNILSCFLEHQLQLENDISCCS